MFFFVNFYFILFFFPFARFETLSSTHKHTHTHTHTHTHMYIFYASYMAMRKKKEFVCIKQDNKKNIQKNDTFIQKQTD